MRVSDPQRFANRVTTPTGVALLGVSFYLGVFTNILFYGAPITLPVTMALASLGFGCLSLSAKYKGETND
jgi:hypothetical protein